MHAEDANDKSATELDHIVVTGIHASSQQSIEVKRNADSIVQVVTAEDLGKFATTNVTK